MKRGRQPIGRHIITRTEIHAQRVTHQVASSAGRGSQKKLLFDYDIGRKRLTWRVIDHGAEQVFDALDEAIAAYNEAA